MWEHACQLILHAFEFVQLNIYFFFERFIKKILKKLQELKNGLKGHL